MDKILAIADAQSLLVRLSCGLSDEYAVLEGAGLNRAMELFLAHMPKVVLLDLAPAPDNGAPEGLRCLRRILDSGPDTKVIVLTEPGSREAAFQAVEAGAYHLQHKPPDLAELKLVIRRAFQLWTVEEQRSRLQEALEMTSAGVEGIAGQCAAIKGLFGLVQKVAPLEPDGAQTRVGRVGRLLACDGGLGDGGTLGMPDRGGGRSLRDGNLTLREARDRVEKGLISTAIASCRGNMVRASELLGVSRPALYDLMKKHGLVKYEPRV